MMEKNRNKRMKTTFEEWNTKLPKKKENLQESLNNSPERAISMKINSFS